MMVLTVEHIRSQYPYLSDAPEHVLQSYREAEARRVTTLRAPALGCVSCGADATFGEQCSRCRLEEEMRS